VPHCRRYILQQQVAARCKGAAENSDAPTKEQDRIGCAPRGLNEGNGFVFVSHTGEVFPSGFLPLAAGNVQHRKQKPGFVASLPCSSHCAMPANGGVAVSENFATFAAVRAPSRLRADRGSLGRRAVLRLGAKELRTTCEGALILLTSFKHGTQDLSTSAAPLPL